MRIEVSRYDHPDAIELIEQVQDVYVHRYGGPDTTRLSAEDFVLPTGVFLIGYLDGRAVAIGGWRAQESGTPGFADGDAEIKRMYVVPEMRGSGLARRLLAELEETAIRVDRTRMVLETGLQQPEAIALYESSGYHPVPKFGVYRCEPDSRCFGKDLDTGARRVSATL